MANVTTLKRISYLPKEIDRILFPEAGFLPSKELNSIESEIISKLGNIITCLKDLEGQVLKTSRDFLKKTTIEGRENDKIMAVRGNLISNKKKYYKNLEEDIDILSKGFYDQFNAILKEINFLQTLSQGKNECYGCNGDTFLQLENCLLEPSNMKTQKRGVSGKLKELPTIKNIKVQEIPPAKSMKEMVAGPMAMKVNSSPAKETVKKFTFRVPDNLKTPEFKKVKESSPKLPSNLEASNNPLHGYVMRDFSQIANGKSQNYSPSNTNTKQTKLVFENTSHTL